MAILWSKSGFIERDDNDLRVVGAKANFYQGGTLNRLTVFQDAGASTPMANPVLADGSARWPAVFIPFTESYDVQVTDAQGAQLYFHTGIPNPDPIEVLPTTPSENLVLTGAVHWEPAKGQKTGYVRCNGGTIGNDASGASELNSTAKAEALFKYLYASMADGQAPVSGGRTGDSDADFKIGNKTITLPDLRGKTPYGLDDMGAPGPGPANRFTGLTFTNGSSALPGSQTGQNSITLTLNEMPAHSHGLSTTTGGASAGHTHAVSGNTGPQSADHTHIVQGDTVIQNPLNHTHGPGTLKTGGVSIG